jgi:hypothetical protein
MHVACFNLHFPGGALVERATLALARIRELPSPCLVLLQEACSTTARVIEAGTRDTHGAFYTEGARPFLLTLAPLPLQRVRVRAVEFPASMTRMGRHAHLVEVGGLALAHVHLESCAASAPLRDAQAAWLRSVHGARALAGDLNGLGGWKTHVVVTSGAADRLRCRSLRAVSPHPMCVYVMSGA